MVAVVVSGIGGGRRVALHTFRYKTTTESAEVEKKK